MLTQVRPSSSPALQDEGDAEDHLLRLLGILRAQDYDFLAPTPASQTRVLARPDRRIGTTAADLLGWSIPCRIDALPTDLVGTVDGAGLLERCGDGLVRARCRVSKVFDCLFIHSAYPTLAADSVFLGPDSHRFADYILRNLGGLPADARILDYAAGSGVGGITAAVAVDTGARLTLADINPKALRAASVNARFAGVAHRTVSAQTPADVDGPFDLIVTHPPFMMDPDGRAYRDGGDLHGARLSLDWTLAALPRLAPGGRFVMHTGVSIVGGRDVLFDALRQAMPATGYSYEYRLLDPDIFGDELDKAPYADVDRIAAIGLSVIREPG